MQKRRKSIWRTISRAFPNPRSELSGTTLSMPTTITYSRGAVVLLPFQFSDQSSAKIRPAVIVSPTYPSEDLLVVAVTSVGEGLRPGEFAIQFWRESGLIHPSFAKRAVASVAGTLVRK